MNKTDCMIRLEKKEEHWEVENLVRESFWNVYRPGCIEHYILHRLRNDKDFVPELDFVLEKEGRVIGQTVFMKSLIKADDGREIPVITLGPICIAPAYKRQGYGRYLLDYALEKAKELGAGAVCLEGSIDFYGKSGFVPAGTKGIRYHGTSRESDMPYFLLKELQSGWLDGITGEYYTPAGYYVDEKDVEEFDKQPHKPLP